MCPYYLKFVTLFWPREWEDPKVICAWRTLGKMRSKAADFQALYQKQSLYHCPIFLHFRLPNSIFHSLKFEIFQESTEFTLQEREVCHTEGSMAGTGPTTGGRGRLRQKETRDQERREVMDMGRQLTLDQASLVVWWSVLMLKKMLDWKIEQQVGMTINWLNLTKTVLSQWCDVTIMWRW